MHRKNLAKENLSELVLIYSLDTQEKTEHQTNSKALWKPIEFENLFCWGKSSQQKRLKHFFFIYICGEKIFKRNILKTVTQGDRPFFLISTLHRLTFFRRWEQHRPRTLYRISALWRSCVLTPARESCFGTAYAAMNSLLHPHNALLTDSCSVSRPGWFRPLMCRPRPCRPLMRRCAKAKVPVGDPRYLPPKARRKHLDCAWCWCQQPWIHNLSGTTEVLCAWGANDRSWRDPQKKNNGKIWYPNWRQNGSLWRLHEEAKHEWSRVAALSKLHSTHHQRRR